MARAHPLTPASLRAAATTLARRDRDLAAILDRCGPPPLWARPPGFATLARIILEQQVSLTSGAAAYRRLQSVAGRVTPTRVAAAGVRRLRAAGLTRQKAAYCTALAEAITGGTLDLAGLRHAAEADVRATLLALPGVGPWTVDVYLLMALRRPDVWPTGDLALDKAFAMVKGAPVDPRATAEPAAAWAPWRAVAARMLWQHYLAETRRRPRRLSPPA